MRAIACAVALAAALTFTGCETGPPPLYGWPSYEASVHAACTDFRDIDLPTHIAALAKQIDEIEAEGKRVPPGVHAHLGYLLSLTGDNTGTRRELDAERRLFPESAVFVDHLLARMKQ